MEAASSSVSTFAKASTRVFSPLLSKTLTPALYEAEPPKVVNAPKPAKVLSWGLAQSHFFGVLRLYRLIRRCRRYDDDYCEARRVTRAQLYSFGRQSS